MHVVQEVPDQAAQLHGLDGVPHQVDADEQDAEAQHDGAGLLRRAVLDELRQHDADKEDERRPGIDIQGDDLGGDGRTDGRAQHDVQRLGEGHHLRVDEADGHDHRSARALDGCGCQRADEHGLEGARRQFFEPDAQVVARRLFEAFAHVADAKQEKADAA